MCCAVLAARHWRGVQSVHVLAARHLRGSTISTCTGCKALEGSTISTGYLIHRLADRDVNFMFKDGGCLLTNVNKKTTECGFSTFKSKCGPTTPEGRKRTHLQGSLHIITY